MALASHLGSDQPFYALNPHGVVGDPVPTSIEEIARAHLASVRAVRPRGSYWLGGHCNGGMTAFEMARQLSAAGEDVSAVLMVAARGDYGAVKPLRALGARYYLSRLRGWLVQPASARRAWVTRAIAGRLGRPTAVRSGPRPRESGADGVVVGGRDDLLFDRYRRLMAAYRPGVHAGPVTLFWPDGERRLGSDDPTLGWGRVAPRLQVVSVAGDHHGCLTTHAADLAASMRARLDAALITAT